jgi:hypothetical protein
MCIRRRRFASEGVHFESEYVVLVHYLPPLRRQSKVVDLIYDDDPDERISPAGRILEQFQKALGDIEDVIGDVVKMRRMRSRLAKPAGRQPCPALSARCGRGKRVLQFPRRGSPRLSPRGRRRAEHREDDQNVAVGEDAFVRTVGLQQLFPVLHDAPEDIGATIRSLVQLLCDSGGRRRLS